MPGPGLVVWAQLGSYQEKPMNFERTIAMLNLAGITAEDNRKFELLDELRMAVAVLRRAGDRQEERPMTDEAEKPVTA